MIKQTLQIKEVKGLQELFAQGYKLYYGVTKNNTVTLLAGKGSVFLTYSPEQEDFILTGIKKVGN